ncbi:MAG TPA: hypothetical protein VM677_15975 [Actinokineospora sp.]|jgi:hypothetical protein|nr:hypothetical protein [Actinokineospora sp.]
MRSIKRSTKILSRIVAAMIGIALCTGTAQGASAAPGVGTPGEVVATPATRPAGVAASDDVTCVAPINIRSVITGKLVSTEVGWGGDYNGMLRARATVEGPWERYSFCHNISEGYWYIMAYGNGRFVSAEIGWSGEDYGLLRARASEIGAWEKFEVECDNNNTTIRSKANTLWVSTDLTFENLLRAGSDDFWPGEWEMFRTRLC